MMQRMLKFFLTAVTALLSAEMAVAAEAGSVIFAIGDVSAERQLPVPLAKGDAVMDDDTVATGDASRAQLLLNDGAKIAIRPNSRLRIDEYRFDGGNNGAGQVVATSDDRSVSTLIKGGFRTITGAIGKENEEAYEVRTPVGVLGIRGTDYSAVFCNADCDWVPGVNPNAPIEDGLYLGVTEGAIFFRNEIADIDLQAGEYAFIPLVERVPARLDAPPPVLLDDNDLQFNQASPVAQQVRPQGSDEQGTAVGFDNKLGTRRAPDTGASGSSGTSQGSGSAVPAQSIRAIDADGTTIDITPGQAPSPNGNRTIGSSTGPVGGGQFPIFSDVAANAPGEYLLDAGNNLVGFAGAYQSRTGQVTANYGIGSARNVDTGFDTLRVLRWGRWSGGQANVDLGGGQVDPLDLTNQSLHWISGPAGAPPVLPITGNASYTLVGATSPTDNFGNSGLLGNATFDADFTNMSVQSTLVIDINSSSWTATGSGGIGSQADPLVPAHMFNGNYIDVTVDGIGGGLGEFSGFFSAPGPASNPAFPGGVGLNYSLQDSGGTTTVSGAAVFGNP